MLSLLMYHRVLVGGREKEDGSKVGRNERETREYKEDVKGENEGEKDDGK